jgi:predicted nucleotidyltransferase
MRLTSQQQSQVRSITRASFGAQVRVWLFGSRISPLARGGDVDLFVESDAPITPQSLKQELLCKIKLVHALDLPVDLIVRSRRDTSPITQIARSQGILL